MKGKLLLGIAISLLFIYLSFWKPDLTLLMEGSIIRGLFGRARIDVSLLLPSLRSANYKILFFMVMMAYSGWWIRAWRWQLIARPVKKVKAVPAFHALMIGYLGNNVLPMRAGEFMRSYIIGKRAEMPMSSALATVVVERVIDVVMLMICFGLSLILFPIPGPVRKGGVIVIVGVVFAIIFLLLLLYQREKALSLTGAVIKIVPPALSARLMRILAEFADGLEVFRMGRNLLKVVAWTFFMWSIYLLVIYCSLFLFDFTSPEYPIVHNSPFTAALVMLTLSTLGIAVPSAPGAVGTYHGICLFGLSLFKIPYEIGMSYAILIHGANFIPMTIVGVYCLFREGLKLADVSGMAYKKGKMENT